jgi:hypothetical protein
VAEDDWHLPDTESVLANDQLLASAMASASAQLEHQQRLHTRDQEAYSYAAAKLNAGFREDQENFSKVKSLILKNNEEYVNKKGSLKQVL